MRPLQAATPRSEYSNYIPEELYRLARRLEDADMAKAAELYQQVIESEGDSSGIGAKAQARLEDLSGKGKFGNRVELILKGVWKESIDPKNFFCMAGATGIGLAGRVAALGRSGGPIVLASFEWALEAPTFVLLGQTYDALHPARKFAPERIPSEIGGQFLTLGLMKLLGGAGKGLHRRLHGIGFDGSMARGASIARWTGAGISFSSHLLSLSAMRGIETLSGESLAPKDFGEFGFDLLAEAMKFSLGSHVGRRIFQNRLAYLEQEAALLRRPFPNLTDGILNHSLGGSFVETNSPTPSLLALRSTRESAVQKTRAQVVLISGAGGNHTSFGEIPHRLSNENWQVRMLVYPGYQNPSDPSPLAGGGLKSYRMAKIWQKSMRQSVRDIVEKHESGEPLILGGFSMGAAGVLDAYHSLPQPLRAKVDGLILAAPAVYPKALDGPNPVVNFIARRLALPGMALLGMNLKKKTSGLDPSIEGLVDTAMEVPRGANHAAVLTIENGRRAAERLAKEGGLPETLLIHAGDHDPTISARSAAQLKTWFGKSIASENEIQVPREDGHYVLVGSDRQLVTEKILSFANSKALEKSRVRLEEAIRNMESLHLKLRARRLGLN